MALKSIIYILFFCRCLNFGKHNNILIQLLIYLNLIIIFYLIIYQIISSLAKSYFSSIIYCKYDCRPTQVAANFLSGKREIEKDREGERERGWEGERGRDRGEREKKKERERGTEIGRVRSQFGTGAGNLISSNRQDVRETKLRLGYVCFKCLSYLKSQAMLGTTTSILMWFYIFWRRLNEIK